MPISEKSIILKDRFHDDNIIPKGDWVWVFGSDEAGRHSKGVAKIAHVTFKAKYGVGRGLTGRAFAIPTKDGHMNNLDKAAIQEAVHEFLSFARKSTRLAFYVTRIGCSSTGDGYPDEEIAPMFANAPMNCCLPLQWKKLIEVDEPEKLAA